ncbi:MAG: ABC transporter ATP-binding protein [Defluviitaleaceae bacterium]|nr:ABC transporter ATP-binding protein [Defluviitaleaceae bacterium]
MSKKYKNFSLDNISYKIPKGAIMGFVGSNGAGKTTTIKSILGLVAVDSGEITVFGEQILPSTIREKIGIVTDKSHYDESWTVADVEKYVSPFFPQWNKSKFDSYINRFEISKSKKVSELSAGMETKLMLAVALAHEANLLILDEPTATLDPMARDDLCNQLLEFVADGENSVLFSTHIVSDLEKISDYITFIMDGRIVFSKSKEDLLAENSSKDITTLEGIILEYYKEGRGH